MHQAFLRLLPLLVFVISSGWADDPGPGQILFRLTCYNHSSAHTLHGKNCNLHGDPCNPEFRLCLSRGSNEDCGLNLPGTVFAFKKTNELGACSARTRSMNVPDPLLKIPMTSRELRLKVTINDVDKYGDFYERKKLIDELSFRVLPKELPVISNGGDVKGTDFKTLYMLRRSFLDEDKPRVDIGAVLQCSPGRFGKLCAVQCVPNKQYECNKDGSRRCRTGWKGLDCSTRDFCASRPCKPRATCSSMKTTFVCSCDGRTGPQCERDADPCLHHRCANSAPCMGVQGRPVCVCPPGFKGEFCSHRDLCMPNPCPGGALCRENGSFGFHCGRVKEPVRASAKPEESGKVPPPTQRLALASKKEIKDFPMLLALIAGAVGILIVVVVVITVTCVKFHNRTSRDHKVALRDGYDCALNRTRQEMPLNPYIETENIYEDADGIYSVEEEPPSPRCTLTKTKVFIRQNSQC